MNRQRKRHAARLPLEEQIRLRIEEAIGALGTLYIEVQDHDEIHGVLIQVNLGVGFSSASVTQANTTVRAILRDMVAQNPEDRCLAGWSACFTAAGKTLASSWQSGEHVEEIG